MRIFPLRSTRAQPRGGRRHSARRPIPHTPRGAAAMAGAVAGTCLASIGLAAEDPPTIRLFPTTVVENVKETGRVARDMEASLQGVIAELEQQWQLYRESKCEGSVGDPGCEQISRQLGNKYMEMLDLMEQHLPEMERTVRATVNSLEGRLRRELGQKATARGLQDVLDSGRKANQPRLEVPARSGGRLSERFRQYYQLVAQADPGGESLALVAADIYLDGKEVLELIGLTRDEIGRSRVMIQIRNELGAITPQMGEVVSGVRSILFGEEAAGASAESVPPDARTPQEFQSPLEL